MPLTMSKKWEGEIENREEKKKHMPSQVQQKKYIYIYTHTLADPKGSAFSECVYLPKSLSHQSYTAL